MKKKNPILSWRGEGAQNSSLKYNMCGRHNAIQTIIYPNTKQVENSVFFSDQGEKFYNKANKYKF